MADPTKIVSMSKVALTPLADIPQELRARVSVVNGAEAGKIFQLTRAKTTIGRDETAEVCLHDTGVSRLHACISFEGREFRVCDLDSANGTLLNGSKVTSYALRSNDKLMLGETLLVFQVDRDE